MPCGTPCGGGSIPRLIYHTYAMHCVRDEEQAGGTAGYQGSKNEPNTTGQQPLQVQALLPSFRPHTSKRADGMHKAFRRLQAGTHRPCAQHGINQRGGDMIDGNAFILMVFVIMVVALAWAEC